jgi:hypothetical protein
MGTTGVMYGKLRRPDTDYSNKRVSLQTKDGKKFAVGPAVIRDDVEALTSARKTFVEKTGGKLRNINTATNYKKLSEAEKKRYKELNPQDFEEELKLSKKTLLGG